MADSDSAADVGRSADVDLRTTIAAATALVGLGVVLLPGPEHAVEPASALHLRYVYAAWGFLQDPVTVYGTPLDNWPEAIDALRTAETLPGVPHFLPIGSVLLYLPLGVVANLTPLPYGVTGALAVLAALGAAGLTTHRLATALPYPVGLRGVLAGVAAVVLVYAATNGAVEPFVALAGVVGALAYRDRRYEFATFALAGAVALSYLAWYLLPLIAVAATRHLRSIDRPIDTTTGFAGGLLLFSLPTLLAIANSIPSLVATDSLPTNPYAVYGGLPPLSAIAVGIALIVAIAASTDDRAVAATLGAAVVSVALAPFWLPAFPVAYLPALALIDRQGPQAIAVVAFVELTVVLGRPPNLLVWLELLIAGAG